MSFLDVNRIRQQGKITTPFLAESILILTIS